MTDRNQDHDELRDRLRAADPAPTEPWPASRTRDLLEATMRSTTPPRTSVSRRLLPAAAAAALLLGGAGSYALWHPGTGTPSAQHPTQHPTPRTGTTLRLAMPQVHPGTASCIRYDVSLLAELPVAFAGTVTATGSDSATLRVDHWYRGGTADTVTVDQVMPSGGMDPGVDFRLGDRYLVSALDGNVQDCNYSRPWSQELADDYRQAFGSG